MKKLILIVIGISLLTYLGCEKKTETTETQPAVTETKPADTPATGETKPGEPQPATGAATQPTAKPEETKPAEPEPGPGEGKEMLGLDLKPVAKWKPVWDADAKVAKWENPAFMNSIVIRMVADKLENAEDLKAAAPNMMQLGSAISKVVKQKKTKKGWWAIVKRDKETDFVYVQKHQEKQLVCSASLTKAKKGTIAQPLALKICESIKAKPEEAKKDEPVKEEPKKEAPAKDAPSKEAPAK